MSDQDDQNGDGEAVSKKTTVRMTSRDLHIHVLDVIIPAEWTRKTPQFWTKERDAAEIYTATVDGRDVRVEFKGDRWHALVDCAGRLRKITPAEDITSAARALARLLEKVQ